MAKIPIRIVTANDRNPTAGLIDRRFGLSADWVIADSGMAGGVLPITLAEFQAGSANFMQATAGEAPAAWYQFNNGITVTGAGVSQWSDQSGNGRHLLQGTDTNRPAKQTDGSILFDGVDNYLQTGNFTLNQPETIYLLFRNVVWTDGKWICDGTGVGSNGTLYQSGVTPQIKAFAGANVGPDGNLPVNTYGAVAVVFNGASSLIQVGTNAPTTGNAGANNMGGFTLGVDGAVGATFSKIQVKEAIIFASAHAAATRAKVLAYLAAL